MSRALARALLACALAVASERPLSAQQPERPFVRQLGAGAATAGRPPRLVYDGAPVVGRPFTLRIEGAPPLSFGTLALSATALDLPLALGGAEVFVTLPANWVTTFATDAVGGARLFEQPGVLTPASLGLEVVAQAALLGVAGEVAVTPALALRCGSVADSQLFGPFPLPRGEYVTRVLADLDRDGRLDVFDHDRLTGVCTVRAGREHGSFAAPVALATLAAGAYFQLVDVDGDGVLDLAVTRADDLGTFEVHRGVVGGFAAPKVVSVAGQPVARTIADVDGDGRVDFVHLVATGSSQTIRVERGTGDLAFAAAVDAGVAPGTLIFALVDIDGDGNVDVVTRTSNLSYAVSLGRGDGTFDGGPVVPPTTTWPPYSSPQWADIDGDGDSDFVVTDVDDRRVVIARFDPVQGFVFDPPIGGFVQPLPVRLMDVEGDGDLDLLVHDQGSYTAQPLWSGRRLSLFENDGTGRFGPAHDVLTSQQLRSPPELAQLVDLDGDGDLDVVTTHAAYFAEPEFGPNTAQRWVYTNPLSTLEVEWVPWTFAGDFDGDGRDDIGSTDGSVSSVVLQSADGSFGPPTKITGSFERAIDVNADGRLDLVGQPLAWWSSQAISVRLGLAGGAFGGVVTTPLPSGGSAIAVGDFDGDGLADAVHGSTSSGGLHFLRGAGTGGFVPAAVSSAPTMSVLAAVADVDGDGHLDVFGAGTGAGVGLLHIAYGVGDGTFAPGPALFGEGSPASVAAADLDVDGRTDLVVVRSAPGGIEVLRQVAFGGFVWTSGALHGGLHADVFVRDFDRDGFLDVGFPNGKVALGDGSGTFVLPDLALSPFAMLRGAVLDANADGLPDLAASREGYHVVSLSLNRTFVR
jgi:hypothetical protein